MISDGLATVVVPLYNCEKYIIDFLDSIYTQDYFRLQLIIRDDCSSDNSYEICEEWLKLHSERFESVKFIKGKKNLGLSGNVSIMLKSARGEYIFFADQDDVWLRDKVTKQVDYLETHPKTMLCLCDRMITDDELNVKIDSEYSMKEYSIHTMHMKEVVKYKYIYAANTMAMRNISSKLRYIPREVICYDSYIAYIASGFGTVDFLFSPLLLYRIHENNLSGNYCAELCKDRDVLLQKLVEGSSRLKMSNEIDGPIICDAMKNYFNIDLNELESPFSYTRIQTFDVDERAREIMNKVEMTGRIGCWC